MPQIPSQEFLVYKMLSTKEVKFTDAKGPLLMTCKFLDFRRKQDIKVREMDREMRCPI